VDIKEWGSLFLITIDQVRKYIKTTANSKENLIAMDSFLNKFKLFLKERNILFCNKLKYQNKYSIEERDVFWNKFNTTKTILGANGDECIIISYDSLLYSIYKHGINKPYEVYDQVVKCSCLHGGDNVATSTITLAWYGAIFGNAAITKSN